MFEVFDHTADVGLRIRSETLDGLFAEAGRALMSVLIDNPEDVVPRQKDELRLKSDGLDYLLVDWLDELLYRFNQHGMLYRQFEVRVEQNELRAALAGERLDPERHRVLQEVKAVTYHGLTVRRTPEGWTAEVILDV